MCQDCHVLLHVRAPLLPPLLPTPRRDTPHTTLHVHAYRNGAKLVVFSHYISYNSEITGKNLPFEVKEVSHRLH